MNAPLTPEQIKRGRELIHELERVEDELRSILRVEYGNGRTAAPKVEASTTPKKRTMSAAGRARIVAAAKARWARQRGEGSEAKATAKPARAKKKRTMSPEARAKIAAAQKKRWAKQRSGK